MRCTYSFLIHVHFQKLQLLGSARQEDIGTPATRADDVEGSVADRFLPAGAAGNQGRPDIELQAGPFGRCSPGLDGEGEIERSGVEAGKASEGELQNVDPGKTLPPGVILDDVDERSGEGNLFAGPQESSLLPSLGICPGCRPRRLLPNHLRHCFHRVRSYGEWDGMSRVLNAVVIPLMKLC
jgi:hypothetical protein